MNDQELLQGLKLQDEIIRPLAEGKWEYEWIVQGGEKGFSKSLKEETEYGWQVILEAM